jgi:hypothetical protein
MAAYNGFTKHEVYHAYVTPRPAHNQSIWVNSDTCWGGSQVGIAHDPEKHPQVEVFPVNPGKELGPEGRNLRVKLVKIDTEGYEPFALETIEPLMRTIDLIIFEISPHFWKEFGLSFEDAFVRIGRLWTVDGFYGFHLPEGDVPFDPCNPDESFMLRTLDQLRVFLQKTLASGQFVNVALRRNGLPVC